VELELSLLFDDADKDRIGVRDLKDKIRDLQTGTSEGDRLLYDTYQRVFERNAKPGSRSEKDLNRVLKMVLCSCEPLTMQALAEAVQIETPERDNYSHHSIQDDITEDHIRRISKNFLIETVDGNAQNRATFSHVSAIEYLRMRDKASQGKVFNALQCHTEMMHACLNFVRSRANSRSNDNERVIDVELAQNRVGININWRGSFLEYAYRFWARHCAVVVRLAGSDHSHARQLTKCVFASHDWSQAFKSWKDEMNMFMHYSRTVLLKVEELSLYLDDDPGIFVAACYGLPQLVEELLESEAKRNNLAHKQRRFAYNKEEHLSPLQIAISPLTFRYSWQEGWTEGAWKVPGARHG